MMTSNASAFARAARVLPGGVSSPVRAFKQVGGTPFFVSRAEGAYLIDVEGKRYIDYIGSWGPMIAGHAHPQVVAAVEKAARDGLSYGAPSPLEAELVEAMIELVPNLEMVRLVSSGTEACMSAIRLARGYTGRSRILKFSGCYHGHGDSFLVKAGSGVLTLGLPNSPGVPAALADLTHTAEFNDLEQVEHVMAEYGKEMACIIVEPVAGNMNCVLPEPGFLQGLRALCDRYGTLLIFDEVMTGFRVHIGGAQGLYQIKPDLSCFGKVIGAGMPVGAYGGCRDVMSHIAPLGPVYQAGTLSGNPVAMAAGLANLALLKEPGFFDTLTGQTSALCQGLREIGKELGVPVQTCMVGAMFGFYFSSLLPKNLSQAQTADIEGFKRFFHGCLKRGVYFAPSAFEAGFVSIAHTKDIITQTLEVAREAMAEAFPSA
jgi:glutamate-1-semialdehyde 2,1-aminomutase